MSRFIRLSLISGVLLSYGCASAGTAPSPLDRCADQARFAYSDRMSDSQLEEIREVMRGFGASDVGLFPIEGESPRIQNRGEVAQALEREYPPLLRRDGITGTVRVLLLVDQDGGVALAHVSESSGHPALDEAAQRVAAVVVFTTPLADGASVCYWQPMPITFMTR